MAQWCAVLHIKYYVYFHSPTSSWITFMFVLFFSPLIICLYWITFTLRIWITSENAEDSSISSDVANEAERNGNYKSLLTNFMIMVMLVLLWFLLVYLIGFFSYTYRNNLCVVIIYADSFKSNNYKVAFVSYLFEQYQDIITCSSTILPKFEISSQD